MGFLDHSTNNIIVDAVLTDKGRELLARNDGSFSIVKFAFGDDEVDYSIITKFGRTVGKEKIIKNTPIMEAQTSHNIALKNRLVSLDIILINASWIANTLIPKSINNMALGVLSLMCILYRY